MTRITKFHKYTKETPKSFLPKRKDFSKNNTASGLIRPYILLRPLSCSRVDSNPQAASMSWPREARTVVNRPLEVR